MKWRKLIELSTSSSPPKSGSRSSRPARRRAIFEALENRKLFAVDLAEVEVAEVEVAEFSVAEFSVAEFSVAEFSVAEFSVAELFSSEAVAVEQSEVEQVELKFDETAEIYTFDAADPRVMMMTFRGADVADGLAKSEEILDDSEFDPQIMTMTGAAGGLDGFDVRSLDTDVDLSATSQIVEDAVAFDEAISDEDLMFYTMGPGPEVETTSVEETLTAEDVNGDGNVTALDMLLVINALNSYGALPSSQLFELPEVASTAGNWDINRDGYVTPLDALLLTNYFNNGGAVASIESSQDALADSIMAAPMIARIGYTVDDELGDEPVDVALEEELT